MSPRILARASVTTDDIRRVVMERWLATGEAQLQREIAEALGCSASTIARVIGKSLIVDGLRFGARHVANSAGGQRAVDAYRPTDSTLRAEINRLRALPTCDAGATREPGVMS